MKILLIFPPQWNPTSPYLSIPLLAGRLKNAGYNADILDLNIEFFNTILTRQHLISCKDAATEIYMDLKNEFSTKYSNLSTVFNELSLEEQTKVLKLQKLDSFLADNTSQLRREDHSCGNAAHYGESGTFLSITEIIDNIDDAVCTMRDKNDFYNPEKLFDAKMIIQEALKIASLPYSPNELIWDNYFSNPLLKMNWDCIELQCHDKSTNMFIDFFEQQAVKIANNNYDFIGISIPDLSQLIPSFTLAEILKKTTSAHIMLGGNYMTQCQATIISHPEIFGRFTDSVMTGDGDTSIIAMAEYIAGIKEITEVTGLIYKNKDGKIVCGKKAEKLNMNMSSYADFSGYDLNLYYSPYIVLPIQLGKGCYWGKCTFCDYYYGQQCFDIKSIDFVIKEIMYYKSKYGIFHFIFIDEAIPPTYYYELSREIIKNNLQIYYYSFARLEKGFTKEVLNSMYNSGCRILMWGYECASERLLSLMNKGIDSSSRLRIMNNSHDVGIWNNALFIIGYPTETKDEINTTLDIIKNNRTIINSCTPSNFALKKNSILANQIGKNGINSKEDNGEFYTVYKDTIDGVTQDERREIRRNFHLKYITENANCLWPVVYSDFDSVLLYMAKFGLDYVSGYRSKRNICPMFR